MVRASSPSGSSIRQCLAHNSRRTSLPPLNTADSASKLAEDAQTVRDIAYRESRDPRAPLTLTRATFDRLRQQLHDTQEELHTLRAQMAQMRELPTELAQAKERISELRRVEQEQSAREEAHSAAMRRLEADKIKAGEEIAELRTRLKQVELKEKLAAQPALAAAPMECSECVELRNELRFHKAAGQRLSGINTRQAEEILQMRSHFKDMADKLHRALVMVGKEMISRRISVHIVQPEVTIGNYVISADSARAKLTKVMEDVVSVFWTEEVVTREIQQRTKEIVSSIVDDLRRHLDLSANERRNVPLTLSNSMALAGVLKDDGFCLCASMQMYVEDTRLTLFGVLRVRTTFPQRVALWRPPMSCLRSIPASRALCFLQDTRAPVFWRHTPTRTVKRQYSVAGRQISVRITHYPRLHAPPRGPFKDALCSPTLAIRIGNPHLSVKRHCGAGDRQVVVSPQMTSKGTLCRRTTAICTGNSRPSRRARHFSSHGSCINTVNRDDKLNLDANPNLHIKPDCDEISWQACEKEGVDDTKNAYDDVIKNARDDWRRCVHLLHMNQPRSSSCVRPSAAHPSRHVALSVGATTLSYNLALSARHPPWDQALRLVRSMEEAAIAPNARTYGMLLRVLRSKWRRALRVWQHMPVEHCDVISANSVIYALSRGKQWQRALDVLRELDAPDAFSFSSAIHGVPGHRWKVALWLLSEAERRGVANTYAYTACLASLEKACQWQSALGILDRMNKLDKPSNATAACVDAGDMRFAWNSILSCLMKASEWEKALSLFLSVESDEAGEMAVAAGLLKVEQYQQVASLLPHLRPETVMVVAYRLAWHAELNYS